MKFGIILGTRPEIIKLSPIIKQCQEKKIPFDVIHTGQHYSYKMDKIFFKELDLPTPNYCLEIGSGSPGLQTGRMLESIEKVLLMGNFTSIIVQGDTNTALAGSLAASKLHLPLSHVEAGLRSFDRKMPEEINRIISDHISDYLFAPTKEAEENLLKEGISPEKIFVVGNTVVDSLFQNIELAKKRDSLLKELRISPKKYCLATIHRAENVDNPEKFQKILDSFDAIHQQYDLEILFPTHPRSKKNYNRFKLESKHTRFVDPYSYLDFLQLMNNAKIILTDSGGVQEESCILGVPCVTLRINTERPETINVGSNLLAGVEPTNVQEAVKIMIQRKNKWDNPYGDGTSSLKIIEILLRNML